MDGADWADPGARALAIYLDRSDDPDRAEDGTPLLDDDFLVLINSLSGDSRQLDTSGVVHHPAALCPTGGAVGFAAAACARLRLAMR